MEMEHERQRRARGTGPSQRERSSMEKVQERQPTRQGLGVSPEIGSEDATGVEKGAAKLLAEYNVLLPIGHLKNLVPNWTKRL